MNKKLAIILLVFSAVSYAELSCTAVNTGSCSGTVVAGISDTSNAHGSNSSSYPKVICCTEQYGGTLNTSCSGGSQRNVTLFHLSAATNAHAELNNETNYNTNVCLASGVNISMGYGTSCSAYDTCLASISGNSNAHVGDCTQYSTLICATTKNLTLTVPAGHGSTASLTIPATLTVRMYDEVSGQYPSGVSGIVWVVKSGGIWDSGHSCTTDSNGNCVVQFFADCSYSAGQASFRGGPFGDDLYRDKNSSSFNLTIDIIDGCPEKISFSIQANLSGVPGDSAEVDGNSAGLYTASQLNKFYACLQDSSITGTPALGLLFAGNRLDNINLSASPTLMEMTQFQLDNKFILAMTDGGCTSIRNNADNIKGGSLSPFSSFVTSLINRVQFALSYPGIDVVGDFSKSGIFTINIEKQETNITQIIVRD